MSNPLKHLSLVAFIVLPFLFPLPASADTIVPDTYIDDVQTWTLAQSPYLISNSASADIMITASGTLNIEAGVVIKTNGAQKFDVYGVLNILGAEGRPVLITLENDDGSPDFTINNSGRWGGLVFYPSSTGNLNYLQAKYTGFVQFPPGGPVIWNQGGNVTVNHSQFNRNFHVFLLRGGTTTVDHSLLDQNHVGFTFEGGDLSLTNSTISNSSDQSFISYGNANSFFGRNNLFVNNRYNPFLNIAIDFDIGSTSFIGGDVNAWRIGGSILTNKILPADTYALNGLIVESGGELTIEPGAIIKAQRGGYLIARGGILNMNGTKDNPIIFTSIADDSVGGNTNNDAATTDGHQFRTGGIQTETGGTANISHTFIKYGSGNAYIGPYNFAYGSLINTGGRMNVSNATIEEGNYTGVHHYGGTSTIENLLIQSGSYNNAIVYDFGNLNVHNSSFQGYTSFYSLWNRENAGVPDVRFNYWGTPEGPYHPTQNATGTAAMIYGNALFIPFLTEPPATTTEINPVIIIPGIMGSAYKNGKLVIDPILHTYDDLIDTLLANGYIKDQTLFSFPYEWRDSNALTANLLDEKIEEVKETCLALNPPDINCEQVDLVAHSMGGLVARAYIQSGDYDQDVDQVIFLGTPHKGAPTDYLQWEAGKFSPDINVVDILIESFFEAEALRNGYLTIFDYIHNLPILSVQELLPTFDYLKDKNTGIIREYPNNYPQNYFLESLNNNITNLLNSGVEITNFVGNSGEDKTIEKIRVIPTNHDKFWEHGEPDGFGAVFGDDGLERGGGDNTVTILGATLDNSIPNETSLTTHRRIPTVEEARIFNILTGKIASTTFDHGFQISPIVLLLQLRSPIDFVITAPDSLKIGKNFSDGSEYNQIPNAFYSGYETNDEYITVLNPIDGKYKVELQGTGSGGEYAVISSYISDDISTSTEFSAVIGADQITDLSLVLNNENPENMKVELEDPITTSYLINNINIYYQLGWVKDKKTRDKLIKWAQSIIRFEEKADTIEVLEKVIDKKLAKMLYNELPKLLEKQEINLSAYNFLKRDLEWLINN